MSYRRNIPQNVHLISSASHRFQEASAHVSKKDSYEMKESKIEWIPTKDKCIESYKDSSGMLNLFLATHIPKATDLREQLAAKISDEKSQQLRNIFETLSKNKIAKDIFQNEVDNELKSFRKKLTAKIYPSLKNNRNLGCIYTHQHGTTICVYDDTIKKYVPTSGQFMQNPKCDWCIPKHMKSNEFMIICFNHGRKRIIQSVDLSTFAKRNLHIATIPTPAHYPFY